MTCPARGQGQVSVSATHAELECAIRCQRDRRNLTPKALAGFIARAMETLDRVKPQGQRTDLPQACGKSDPRPDDRHERTSAAETAEQVGVSARTIERVRAVMDSEEEVKAGLQNGTLAVNRASQAVKEAETVKQDSAPSKLLVLQFQLAVDPAVQSGKRWLLATAHGTRPRHHPGALPRFW